MNPLTWIEFRNPKRILLFLALVAAAIILCAQLPQEAWKRWVFFRGSPRLPILMLILWIGGLFTALFLRAQDPYITHGIDHGRRYRHLGFFAAFIGFLIGLFLLFKYLR